MFPAAMPLPMPNGPCAAVALPEDNAARLSWLHETRLSSLNWESDAEEVNYLRLPFRAARPLGLGSPRAHEGREGPVRAAHRDGGAPPARGLSEGLEDAAQPAHDGGPHVPVGLLVGCLAGRVPQHGVVDHDELALVRPAVPLQEDPRSRSSGPLSGAALLLDTCSLLQPAQFFVRKRSSEKSEVLVTVSVLEAKSCGAETVPELVTSPQTTPKAAWAAQRISFPTRMAARGLCSLATSSLNSSGTS